MATEELRREKGEVKKEESRVEKSYFDVLGLCCASEVPLIEKILKQLDGVKDVTVIVPSRTVIVLHDSCLVSQHEIVKALNKARLEANVRMKGEEGKYKSKWPSPYVFASGTFLILSLLHYVYPPLHWLALAAVVVGGPPILLRAIAGVRNLTLDVNILILIAVMSTVALRDYLEAGTIVFLFTIAEWLESRASHKATAVMTSLVSMAPRKATIAETGAIVNVEEVKPNTVVAVKEGEVIPVDGVVVEGTCDVDEKTLTGESFPVPKHLNSTVWAGTINVNGYINVRTTALAEDCVVAKMAKLVEEAQNNKSSTQRLIDECAKYYTPAIVAISAGLAIVPAALRLENQRHWFHLALVVLVSACPCGLILSTPVATFCALSKAATTGLLIKGGDYLEILAKTKVVAFDKTGTITRGEFTLTDFRAANKDVCLDTLLYRVSSIESKSSHPVATVLVEYAKSQGIEPKPEHVLEFQSFPGEGISGQIDGSLISIGNSKLGLRLGCVSGTNVEGSSKGRTKVYVYSGGEVIGMFSVADACRSGVGDAIRDLKSMGILTAMLTGDSHAAASHAQDQLGNTIDRVHAELLPEQKANIIQDLKSHIGPVAMVGDGVNDAPALATADVGISMGVSGSALAKETGHVVLMSNDIRKIPFAIRLARKTRRKVVENVTISVAFKAGVLAFAFARYPLVWVAVLVDMVTCLTVIFNSMLLLGRAPMLRHSRKKKCHSGGQCCNENVAAKHCESQECSVGCQSKMSAYKHVSCDEEKGSCCRSSIKDIKLQAEDCVETPTERKGSCRRAKESNIEKRHELHHHEARSICGHAHKEHNDVSIEQTPHQEMKNCCDEDHDHKETKEEPLCEDIASPKDNDTLHCEEHCPRFRGVRLRNKTTSIDSDIEAVAKHACIGLMKRDIGVCCTSYRKECGHVHDHFVTRFGGGLTEIVTE